MLKEWNECECCRLLYGDQAKYFEQELKPRIKHSKLGQISMVNNGSNMHGSQVANALLYAVNSARLNTSVSGKVG